VIAAVARFFFTLKEMLLKRTSMRFLFLFQRDVGRPFPFVQMHEAAQVKLSFPPPVPPRRWRLRFPPTQKKATLNPRIFLTIHRANYGSRFHVALARPECMDRLPLFPVREL